MTIPPRALAACVLLVAPVLAGCLGAEAIPDAREVTAAGGKASDGWAYDGVGLVDAQATLSATLQNAANTGSIKAEFKLANSTWTIDVSTFRQAEGKDFMDGGVAFELGEHGDSGVADKSIPRIHALVAAWGVATVTRDGKVLSGASNSSEWSAHLMVSANSVRGPDGRIATADGARPYSPDAPADARTFADDPQAILWVKSPDGEGARRAEASGTGSKDCAGPECVLEFPLETYAGAPASIVVTLAPSGGAPVSLAEATVSIVDESGAVVESREAQTTPAAPMATLEFEIPADKVAGPLTVRVEGAGAFTAGLAWSSVVDDHPFIVLTWDDIVVK